MRIFPRLRIFRRGGEKRGARATPRKGAGVTPPSSRPAQDDAITLRLPKGTLKVVGGLLVLALAGAGVWYFAIRDTGPTDEEIAAEEREEEQERARAEAATCETQVGGLLASLEDLESRLSGAGVQYNDYLQRVGDASAAYGDVPIGDLAPACLSNVGFHAEKAMNAYVSAGNTWGDCIEDFGCDIDSVDPELQDQWLKASDSLDQAQSGLTDLATP